MVNVLLKFGVNDLFVLLIFVLLRFTSGEDKVTVTHYAVPKHDVSMSLERC